MLLLISLLTVLGVYNPRPVLSNHKQVRLPRVCLDLAFPTTLLANHHGHLRPRHPTISKCLVSLRWMTFSHASHSFASTAPSGSSAWSLFSHLKNPCLIFKIPLGCHVSLGSSLDALAEFIPTPPGHPSPWDTPSLNPPHPGLWEVVDSFLAGLWLLPRSGLQWLSLLPAYTLPCLILHMSYHSSIETLPKMSYHI